MVTAATFRNVVEQGCNKQYPLADNLLHYRGRQRVILFKLASVDIGQQSNGADRMFIDRVMVVHVELHLRDHTAKIGNESTKNSRFIHPAQHRFRVARRRQYIQEQRVGSGIPSNHFVNQPGIPLGGAHSQRVDFQFMQVRQMKYLKQTQRVLRKETVFR